MATKKSESKSPKKARRVTTPWIPKHVAIVRKYYERSTKLAGRSELRELRNKLIAALAEAGRPGVTIPMLDRVSLDNKLSWGKNLDKLREEDRKTIEELAKRGKEFATQSDFLVALRKLIPRFTTEKGLRQRLSDLDIALPKFGTPEVKENEVKEEKSLGSLADVPGLRSYLLSSIDSGALVQEGGIETFFTEAGLRYSDDMRRAGFTLTLPQFVSFVEELVWTKKTQDSLTDYLRHASNFDEAIVKWQRGYSHIPLDWVKEEAKWVRGVSSAVAAPVAMIPGLGGYMEEGWYDKVVDIEIPDSSFTKPYQVNLPPESKCSWLVLNGSNIGLVYNRAIEENPLRRKLAEAQLHGIDVVFLTNVFGLEITKASGALYVYRARLSGLNTNIDLLDLDYQEEARRIMETKPGDEVVFEAPMQRVVNLLTGFHKIVTKPDGQPEFSGKMYLVLGWRDEQLFATITGWLLNYIRHLTQGRLKGEIQLAARMRASAKKEKDFEAFKAADKEHARLMRRHTMSVTSAITPEEINRFTPKIRSIILSRLKELAPGVEVIGQGTSYVRLNDKPTITLHIPGHIRVTDTLLADYAARSGPKIIRKEIAKTTVICHPYALQARDTVREADHDGKRDSVQIFVAPILVDGKFMRTELGDVIRSTHPIQRAIFNEQFKPGALKFSYHGDANVVAQDFWPITRPLPTIHVKRKGSGTKLGAYPDFGNAPYIWYAIATDPHLGGRARQTIWSPERNENLGMFEASLHSMRRSGYLGSEKFGIHMWSCNDDPTQAHNYATEMQPSPDQIPNARLEEISRNFKRRMEAASGRDYLRIFEEYQQLIHGQIDARGIDWVQMQMEDLFDRFTKPNVDFFSAVLARAKSSGLIVKPVSEHYGFPFDMRDLGIINWGSGNHFDHSVEGMLTEGFLYARDLQGKLLQREEWRGQNAFMEKWVKAPLYSNFFCAWGTIKVGSGYEWGMDLRPSPTRMGSWGDTLLGAIRNDVLRGNPTRIMEGRMRIQTYGDKHFFGTAITQDVVFHMCASGTHTDRYGEHGFPPNNTGVSFIGIPVEGPRVPLLFRYLRYDQLAQLMQPGVTFDWETFLPNPV